jgi:protein-S-isoprenylcysteine O-methyltransferase Ste14
MVGVNVRHWFETAGWLACVVYSTIPAFWLMIHPFAERWRSQPRSPYRILIPLWILMWVGIALVSSPWRLVGLYSAGWSWIPAGVLFAAGLDLYSQSSRGFSAKQLGGLPEIHGQNPEQRLVTHGVRSRVRHPVYLAHLCEMLSWSIGTGLAVCWTLTIFAIVTGALMIRLEDSELEKRFGDSYRAYRSSVPAVIPRVPVARQL